MPCMAYRIGHWIWYHNCQALALYFQNQISVSFSVDIHSSARIAGGMMLNHATGTFIGETAVVEDDVFSLQSVTLGGTGKTRGDCHPKNREGVMIGDNATILGNVAVGRSEKIGAEAIVLHAVPTFTIASVVARQGCQDITQ